MLFDKNPVDIDIHRLDHKVDMIIDLRENPKTRSNTVAATWHVPIKTPM